MRQSMALTRGSLSKCPPVASRRDVRVVLRFKTSQHSPGALSRLPGEGGLRVAFAHGRLTDGVLQQPRRVEAESAQQLEVRPRGIRIGLPVKSVRTPELLLDDEIVGLLENARRVEPDARGHL